MNNNAVIFFLVELIGSELITRIFIQYNAYHDYYKLQFNIHNLYMRLSRRALITKRGKKPHLV